MIKRNGFSESRTRAANPLFSECFCLFGRTTVTCTSDHSPSELVGARWPSSNMKARNLRII